MKYLLMIVLLCSSNQARANFYTGSELLERCEAYLSETGSAAEGNTCAGYVMGIVDSLYALVSWEHTEKIICIPGSGSVRIDQVVRIVTKYLQESPENLHLTAGTLTLNALVKAFPCE